MEYLTNCTIANGEDIEKMTEKAKEITYKELLKKVEKKILKKLFPIYENCSLTLENDYSVSFYKSKFKGVKCVFVEHSRIEYIFT